MSFQFSFGKCLSLTVLLLRIYAHMPLSTQLFLSILHPKRKFSFPFVSTLSLELPLSRQLSLLLLISSPSSGFQKVTLPTPWISSDLHQSYLNHCRTPHCPVIAPLKPFPAMFLSWHSPAQHHPVIFHNLERSSPSVQAQHTASWRSTSFQPHLLPLTLYTQAIPYCWLHCA